MTNNPNNPDIQQQVKEYFSIEKIGHLMGFSSGHLSDRIDEIRNLAADFAQHHHEQEMKKVWHDEIEPPDTHNRTNLFIVVDESNDAHPCYYHDAGFECIISQFIVSEVKKWAYLSDLTKTEEG